MPWRLWPSLLDLIRLQQLGVVGFKISKGKAATMWPLIMHRVQTTHNIRYQRCESPLRRCRATVSSSGLLELLPSDWLNASYGNHTDYSCRYRIARVGLPISADSTYQGRSTVDAGVDKQRAAHGTYALYQCIIQKRQAEKMP